MQSYLKNRKQRVQINNKFNSERDKIAPFFMEPFFNLFINSLVYFIKQSTLSNYTDDDNLFVFAEDKELTNS